MTKLEQKQAELLREYHELIYLSESKDFFNIPSVNLLISEIAELQKQEEGKEYFDRKIEYKIEYIDDNSETKLEAYLNKRGEEGWELIQLRRSAKNISNYCSEFLFESFWMREKLPIKQE
jgi:hypothetical protein